MSNETDGQTDNNVSSLYVSENEHEIDILGVKVYLREIPGEEYMSIVDKCTDSSQRLNRKAYLRALVDKLVVRPKLDPSKLNSPASAIFLYEAEKLLGVSEEAIKNFEGR